MYLSWLAQRGSKVLMNYVRAEHVGVSVLDLYLEGLWLESWPGHWLL